MRAKTTLPKKPRHNAVRHAANDAKTTKAGTCECGAGRTKKEAKTATIGEMPMARLRRELADIVNALPNS